MRKLKRSLYRLYAQGQDYLRRLRYAGAAVYCPVCEKSYRKFLPTGVVHIRHNALCPGCNAMERHRLVWVFFEKQTNLLDGRPRRMLHVAPEPMLEKRLNKVAGLDYLTADLYAPNAMVKMDITDIQYPAESFDIIYCSHVLEHVPDDRQAMRELHRVLKPGGWAVLLVPIVAEETFEDPSIIEPEERLRVFGQADHVRIYGPDYIDRLREAGFTVRQYSPADIVEEENLQRLGVVPEGSGGNDIFFCTK